MSGYTIIETVAEENWSGEIPDPITHRFKNKNEVIDFLLLELEMTAVYRRYEAVA